MGHVVIYVLYVVLSIIFLHILQNIGEHFFILIIEKPLTIRLRCDLILISSLLISPMRL